MIINTNIGSLNAQRNLTATNNSMQKSLQKLSSGYRINSASDDAAGLAITQKMEGQVKGLNQAVQNSQSAISLIQTGEGALNETQSILQRMRELAVQSASSTNTTDDRSKIQSEMDQLTQEISRISNTTQFNTQNLLAGGLNDTFQIGANKDQNISLSISAMDAKSLGVAATMYTTNLQNGTSGITGISNVTTDVNNGAIKISVTNATATTSDGSIGGDLSVANAASFTGTSNETFQLKITTVSNFNSSTTLAVSGLQYSTDAGQTWQTASLSATATTYSTFDLGSGIDVTLSASAAASFVVGETGSIAMTPKTASLTLADSSSTAIGNSVTINGNASSVTVGDASSGKTATLGIDFSSLATTTTAVTILQNSQAATAAVADSNGNVVQDAVTNKGINVMSQDAANSAIQTIDNAINKVSEERSKLGAYQNRLEHTINNLSTASQNLTAAQSTIQDVDMASEMSSFTKSQILSQAGVAMLAQANQAPQAVLKLLG